LDLTIKPHIGIGDIEFGLHRKTIRQKLTTEFSSFKKAPSSVVLTDYFPSLGLFVAYNKNDLCEAVECASPAKPILSGISLMEMSMGELKLWFEQHDKAVDIEFEGLMSYAFGVGIWHPVGFDEPEETPESVIVFRKGYYDIDRQA
jgi:hypothetical protein